MKKIKKIKATISTLLASAIVASSASAIYASATAPSAYVDITYSNGMYIANVIFENVPDITITSFTVNVGDGWDVADRTDWGISCTSGTTFASNNMIEIEQFGGNDLVVILGYTSNDRDVNGTVFRFPVTKNSNFTDSNAKINISFEGGMLATESGTNYVEDEENAPQNPVMLKANEFIVGDANGDGTVDASDSSTILNGIENHPIYKVYNIRKTYNNYFPGAKSASAPDANRNGFINQTDADLVLDYYVDKMVGNAYSGPIGTIDVYEVFE